MRKNSIAMLALAAIAILAFTAFGSLLILQSVRLREFEDGLYRIAREEGWKVFSTTRSGQMEPLPFFHRIRFPVTKIPPAYGVVDGTTVKGIRDGSGFFDLAAQFRREKVCYVILKNHSAEDETLVRLKRRLNAAFFGITVVIAD